MAVESVHNPLLRYKSIVVRCGGMLWLYAGLVNTIVGSNMNTIGGKQSESRYPLMVLMCLSIHGNKSDTTKTPRKPLFQNNFPIVKNPKRIESES